MKKFRLPALLLALALIVCSVGCLADKDGEDTSTPTDDPNATSAAVGELDRDAVAIELDDIVITAGDIADSYSYFLSYLSYYGMDTPTTDEDIKGYVDLVVEDSLSGKLPTWKASELGVSLTEEDLKEIDDSIATERQSIIDDYVSYATEQAASDTTITDVESYAMDLIEQDVGSYYNGISFDQYLENYRESLKEDKINEKVEAAYKATITVTKADAKTWYDTTLEEQTTSYTEDATAYRTQQTAYEAGTDTTPNLYAPEGYRRVQLITINPTETLDESYTTNATEMTTLEAEYGKLLLNGGDATREAEIIARYTELKELNDAMYEAYISGPRASAQSAIAELQGGKAFTEVMAAYDSTAPTDAYLANGELLYTVAEDSAFKTAVWETACKLAVGEYSDVIEVDGSYYIVTVVEDVTAGAVAYADVETACEEAALSEAQETAWTNIQDEWLTEAKAVAVFHSETYAMVGKS